MTNSMTGSIANEAQSGSRSSLKTIAVTAPQSIAAKELASRSPRAGQAGHQYHRSRITDVRTQNDNNAIRQPLNFRSSFCDSLSSLTPNHTTSHQHPPHIHPFIPSSYSSDPQDDPSLFSPDRWAEEVDDDDGPLKHCRRDTSGVWPGNVVCASVRTRTVTTTAAASSDVTKVDPAAGRRRIGRWNRASAPSSEIESRNDDLTLWENGDRASVFSLTPVEKRTHVLGKAMILPSTSRCRLESNYC